MLIKLLRVHMTKACWIAVFPSHKIVWSMSSSAQPVRNHSWFHNRWTTLTVFAGLSLFACIDRFIAGALLTPIKADFHVTDEQLGRLNLIFIITYVLFVPLGGYVGDRFPRKGFIFSALLIWSAATLGSGLAAGFGALLIWRAIVGLGEGVYSSLTPTWIADTFGPRLRSMAFAVIQSTSQIGAWIAYAGGGAVAAAFSWHQSFFVAGVPGLLIGIAVIFLIEPKRGAADGYQGRELKKPTRTETAALFRQKSFLLYLTGYFVRMMGVTGIFFWGAVYLHRQFDVPNQAATAFIGSAYLFTGVPGIFFASFLAGRWARRGQGAYAFWLAGSELSAAVFVSIMLLYVHDLATARILLLGQMFFAGNSWGVITPLLFEVAPLRVRNLAVSSAQVSFTAGSALLGSELIGLASDQWGIAHALLLAPLGYILASICWLLLGWRQAYHRGSVQLQQGNATPATEGAS
jgi:predicted MFS family arabinose efflux permease